MQFCVDIYDMYPTSEMGPKESEDNTLFRMSTGLIDRFSGEKPHLMSLICWSTCMHGGSCRTHTQLQEIINRMSWRFISEL